MFRFSHHLVIVRSARSPFSLLAPVHSKVGQASHLPRSDASPSGQNRRSRPLTFSDARRDRSTQRNQLPCWAGGTPALLSTARLSAISRRKSVISNTDLNQSAASACSASGGFHQIPLPRSAAITRAAL